MEIILAKFVGFLYVSTKTYFYFIDVYSSMIENSYFLLTESLTCKICDYHSHFSP